MASARVRPVLTESRGVLNSVVARIASLIRGVGFWTAILLPVLYLPMLLLNHPWAIDVANIVEVNPRGTTKVCSNCGVETDKPLWVREHSCPSCGYEDDRDANAAKNILQRAFSELGMGQAESTPPETATATDTRVVSASCVIERGSPALNAVRRRAG